MKDYAPRELWTRGLHMSTPTPIEARWYPISCAPKDGTPILCFRPDALGHGFSDQSGIDVLWWEDGNWTYDGDGRITIDLPTHWMPLPAPPRRNK